MYDYAYHAKRMLGMEPIIAYNANNKNDALAIERFGREFYVLPYSNFSELNKLIERNKIPYFYAIKYGCNDGIISSSAINLIHSVFSKDLNDVHGERYAVVSEWQSIKSGNKIPFVPHMLSLDDTEEDLRESLGISEKDVVIGRHGGYDTFNVDFVITSIVETLEKRRDVWFLFLNTEKKIDHPRCIYLDKIIDIKRKTMFINTCDAMIHARDYGETFGLSVLEFASRNKTIIAYDNEEIQNTHPLGGRNHFLFLQDQCYKYSSKEELTEIFLNLTKESPFNTNFLSEKFSPTNVMKLFKERFL